MEKQVLKLSPDAVEGSPAGESVWERAIIDFIRQAFTEGKTITLSTEESTLTPSEVARGLNLSRSTVSRRIASGAIESIRIGTHHHIPRREYERLWEETMTSAVDASIDDIEAELSDPG